MGPALLRFYGGTAAEWAGAPWPVALQHYRAMPRLLVRESGSAAPHLGGKDLNTLLEEVTAMAEGQARTAYKPEPVKRAPQKPTSLEDIKRKMAAMGIKVDIK